MSRLFPGWTVRLALVFVSLTGCNGEVAGDPTYAVQGTVTLDGDPLSEGEIYFVSAATGQVDILPIRNGQFQGEATAGSRSVQIMAYRETMQAPMPGEAPEPSLENYLPARYHAESVLEAQIQPTGDNRFDFELESD